MSEALRIDPATTRQELTVWQEQRQLITAQQRQLDQLTAIVARMAAELDRLDKAAKEPVTIHHAEALALGRMIRARAGELCAQYRLDDKRERLAVNRAIKKDVLKKFDITDLHDLPRTRLEEAGQLVSTWSSYALILELRGRGRGL